MVTPSHLVLTRFLNTFCSLLIVLPRIPFILFRDFFTWLFQSGKEQLEVLAAIDIPAIQGLVGSSKFLCSKFQTNCQPRSENQIFERHFSFQSIFERWPDRLSLRTDSGHYRLKMETEVQLFLLKPAFAAFVRLSELYQSILFQDGVLQLVAALRTPWEASRNTALEVVAQ